MPSRQTTVGKLAETSVRNAKPRDRAYKLSDGGGLYLLVQPNGRRYWRLKYRLHGREKTLALGVYPSITMTEARRSAEAAKKLVVDGLDPVAARKYRKDARAGSTFNQVAKEWFDCQSGMWKPNHAGRVWRSLEMDVLPKLGRVPVQDVKSVDCLAVIRDVEARGAIDTAKQIRQRIRAVFRYAVQTGRIEVNPADQLHGVIASRKVVHRAAVSPEKLPAFLRALEDYQGHPVTRLALKLQVLTFVRPGELRLAKWRELDLEARQWRIPAERMKMGEEHIVPLADQAVEVLAALSPLSGRFDLLFPSIRNVRRPMSENTLTYAIRKRLGFDATAHGFRSTASTILNETGFRPDVIERQLAHAERNKIRAAYHHSQYLSERVEMMQWWANFLDSQRDGAKVIPIRRQER